MGRISRTPEEVGELVERVIRKDRAFDCVKPGGLSLHKPDAWGCNWGMQSFTGPEKAVRECTAAIGPVLRVLQVLVHVEVLGPFEQRACVRC